MKKHLAKLKKIITQFIKIFNFGFFLVSIAIWLFITIKNLATQPFQLSIFWDAFNAMYGQLSFKVGCIFLIIFNGLQSIRGLFFKYYDLLEIHENLTTVKNIATKKKPRQ